MRKFLILVVLMITAMPGYSEETCLDGRCFENTREINNLKFELQGIGRFNFLFKELYTAAFYTTKDISNIEAALSDAPKSLVIEYHMGIKVKWMNKAARRNLIKNPNVNFEAIEERFNKIGSSYTKVSDGERYELRYFPEEGTTLWLNGTLVVTIPGYDFARAYFGIWLSEMPASNKLRDNLIGVNDDA